MTVISSLTDAVAEVEVRFKCIDLPSILRIADPGELGTPLDTTEILAPPETDVPTSEGVAAEIWLKAITDVGRGCSTIYWRIPPEIRKSGDTYRVYSRQIFT